MAKDEEVEKPSKHKNKKIVIDGIKFDSKAEGEYYERLKYEKGIGHIKNFELQPKFILQDKFTHKKDGNIRAVILKADFKVITNHNYYYIVDIKGKSTPVALLKRKMFLNQFPHIDLFWFAKS
jgi:hypothetical protein